MTKNEKTRRKEYDKMKKGGELTGIDDLIAIYGEYDKELKIGNEYLRELEPKIMLSTTDNTF